MKGRKLTGIGLMHFLLWMGSFHPALEKESLATDMEKLDRREAGDYLFLIRRETSFLFSVAEVCVPGSYAYLSWTAYAMIPTVPVDAFYLHVTGNGGTLTGDVFLLDYGWAAAEVERTAALRKGSREAHLLERLWRWREKCEESSILAFTRAMKGCWQPDPGCFEAAPVYPEALLMAERVRA